ncbi:MAG: AAA family ATPase [Acidimicrobiales bacterium]
MTRTRPAKRHTDADDLLAEWWDRARALGFKRRDLARCVHRVTTVPAPPPDEAIFARLAAPDGLCSGTSVFTRADVIAAVADIGMDDASGRERPLLLPANEVERTADEFLASDHVVELLAEQHRSIASLADQPVFTTREMLTVQAGILDRCRAGRGAGVATVSHDALARALGRNGHLSAEQRDLVASFCTSGDRVQCAVGRAGAGKTTAMRAAVEAWRVVGYRVLGTAVKGEAARHLGHEAGIESETLAWHLAHTDPQSGPLDARTVLIVDEASTVSDRDLARLLWLAEATGAAVRLIGDPAQHGAVGAGGMFGVLCADPGAHTPELQTSHRVVDAHDRAAADALREGNIAEALAQLDAAGHLHIVSDELDLYLDLLERWWRAQREGDEHPMVDRRNRTRWQLNRLAHRLLQATGDVGQEEMHAARDRRFSVGDRVVAKIGDRSLHPAGRQGDYVRNGATGTVVSFRKHRNDTRDCIVVAFDRLGLIELPAPSSTSTRVLEAALRLDSTTPTR